MAASKSTKVTKDLTTQVNGLETTRKQVGETYRQEDKVKVQGSPMYRPFFGNNMPIIVNGVALYVPLDGQTYEIPETYAAIFQERIALVDEQERMRKRMADVQKNLETYAGEKNLIKHV